MKPELQEMADKFAMRRCAREGCTQQVAVIDMYQDRDVSYCLEHAPVFQIGSEIDGRGDAAARDRPDKAGRVPRAKARPHRRVADDPPRAT